MRLITVREAATLLNVTDARLYEMIRSQIVPPGVAVFLGRRIRINEGSLEAWVTAGGSQLAGGWRRESAQ